MGRHNVDHRESDSESEIAVSGGHAPQPEAKKIKSCACSVACMPLCNVSALERDNFFMGLQNKSLPQEYGLDMMLSYRVLQGWVYVGVSHS